MSEKALELHAEAVQRSQEERFEEAVALLTQAVQVWEDEVGPEDARLAPTLTNLAGALQALGKHDEALPHATRAVELATEGELSAQSTAQLAFVQAAVRHDDTAETAGKALAALKQHLGPDHPMTRQAAPALEMLASGASDAFVVDVQLHQAHELLEGGEPLQALSLVQGLLVRAQEENARDLEAAARVVQVRALIALDRHDEAAPLAERALELARQSGDDEAVGQFRALLATTRASKGAEAALMEAKALLEEGHLRSAVSLLDALLVGAEQAAAEPFEASVRSLAAQAALALGEHEQVGVHAARGRALALKLSDPNALAHFDELVRLSVAPPVASRLAKGVGLVDQGQWAEAVDVLAEVLPQLDGGPDEANARGAMAHALLNLGRARDALPHLQRARSIAERASAHDAVQHYDALIAKIS